MTLGLFSVHFYLIILFLFYLLHFINCPRVRIGSGLVRNTPSVVTSSVVTRPWLAVRYDLITKILFLDATQINKWVTEDRTCEERLHGHAPKR